MHVEAMSAFHIDDVCCSFNKLWFSGVCFNRAFDPDITLHPTAPKLLLLPVWLINGHVYAVNGSLDNLLLTALRLGGCPHWWWKLLV